MKPGPVDAGTANEESGFRGQTDLTLSENLMDETSVKVAAPSVHETPHETPTKLPVTSFAILTTGGSLTDARIP
jgi:hypothetical protein